MTKAIQIPVHLDARTFRRYCAFDAFYRQRRWYWPALIGMGLITVSLAGLFGWVGMSDTTAGLLMGLGIAVPMVNLGLWIIPIEVQVSRQRLKEAPLVYALRLDDAGVRVENGQKPEEALVELPWSGLWAAFRRGGDIYLYANPGRALILPAGQASVSDSALWTFITKRLGAEKCFDGRKTAA